jgi:hypothetical protein
VRPEASAAIDFATIFRLLIRRGRVPPSEFGRLTLSQALVILDNSDPDDPHGGGLEITSFDQLRSICEVDD